MQPSTIETSSSKSSKDKEIPTNIRDIRKLIKNIQKEQKAISSKMNLLVQSLEILALKNDILYYRNTQLNSTLIAEKKHQKRGQIIDLLLKKRLNIVRFGRRSN